MTFDRRRYQREYAIRARDRKRKRGAVLCPLDGFALVDETDGLGRLVTSCLGCDRRRAHRCMDCNQPIGGMKWRCELCGRRRQAQQLREYAQRIGKKELCRREKERYRHDAAFRKRRNDYKKEWRAKNPLKVAMQKRRSRLAGKTCGYATREKGLAYLKAYNAARKAEMAVYMQRYNVNPKPHCAFCSTPIPFDGRGRPRKYCEAHRHPSSRQVAVRPASQQRVGA